MTTANAAGTCSPQVPIGVPRERRRALKWFREQFAHVRLALGATLLISPFISVQTVIAETEEVDGVTYTYYVENGGAIIGTGNWPSAIPETTAGELIIPSALGEMPVIGIGVCAFRWCDQLTSVVIPSSVTSIGGNAFDCCSNLVSVTLPEQLADLGDFAFYNCEKLSVIDLPSSVVRMGCQVFHNTAWFDAAGEGPLYLANWLCEYKGNPQGTVEIQEGTKRIADCALYEYDDLTAVIIPESVEYIGEYAFIDSPSLESIDIRATNLIEIGYGAFAFTPITTITLPNSLTTLGDGAFYGCAELASVVLSESLTQIGEETFSGCYSLSAVVIPDSVTAIGDYAFGECYELADLTIGNSVTNIGIYAFGECYALSAVTIPDSVTAIGENAFAYCGLTSVVIPDSVTTLGYLPFEGCYSLESLTIGDGLTTIDENAFNGGYDCLMTVVIGNGVTTIGGSAFYGCSALADLTIGTNVTAIGEYAFADCYALTELTIPEGVTTIGDYAFRGCTGLTDIVIPNSVTSLGLYPFEGCTSLESLTIGSGLTVISEEMFSFCSLDNLTSITIENGVTTIGDYAFAGCSSLTSIIIPDSVTSIGEYALNGCSSLTSIVIPDSVTSIGSYAFTDCSELADITMSTNLAYLGDGAFEGTAWYDAQPDDSALYLGQICIGFKGNPEDVVIADGTVAILSWAFGGCGSLTSLVIPDSITVIEEGTFAGCSGLESLTIPDSVTTIGFSAFEGCDSLSSLTIGNGVTSIGAYAFSECYNLASVMLGNSVEIIDENAFLYCESLTAITIPDSVRIIEWGAFEGCSALTEVTIPDGVTEVGGYAFSECSSLESVIIGNGVTTIGEGAFGYCGSLTSVTIGTGVTSIGAWAFTECGSLTAITIPDNVTSIGDEAFGYCAALEDITMSANVTSFGSNVFFGTAWYDAQPDDAPLYMGSYYLGFKGTVEGDLIIRDGTTAIAAHAFDGCADLTSVTIPDSVTTIGEYAFRGCSGLTAIVIPDSVTTIGNWAFGECSSLADITMSVSVINFGSNVFVDTAWYEEQADDSVLYLGQYCLGAKGTITGNLVINDGTTCIAADAFLNFMCGDPSEITSVSIPDSVTTIGAEAFYGLNSAITLTIGNNVVRIGDYAFAHCSSLTSVNIPASVTVLNQGVFSGCASLTSVTIGTNVTTIGDDVFEGCESLTSITIPASVTALGDFVFNGCTSLATVRYLGNAPILKLGGTYWDAPSILKSEITQGTTGWDGIAGSTELPAMWPTVGNDRRGIQFRTADITFDANGGTVNMALTNLFSAIAYGALPEATRLGYAQTGWFTAAEGGTEVTAESIVPETAATLYAQWEVVDTTITFNANGGTSGVTAQDFAWGEAYGTLPVATRTGLAFEGWFTEADGGNQITAGSIVPNEEGVVLYAHWTTGYTLTVKHGKAAVVSHFIAGADVAMMANAASANEEFQKWTFSPVLITFADGFDEFSSSVQFKMPAANVTMTASYIKSATAGSLGITLAPNTLEKPLVNVQWSVDKKAWYAPTTVQRLKAGSYTLYFRSTDGQWILPASQKAKVVAGAASAPVIVSVVCTYAPAFNGDALVSSTDAYNASGSWSSAQGILENTIGQLNWTGLYIGLRAKIGPLPLGEGAVGIKLASGKLPAGLKIISENGQQYIVGIPSKAGDFAGVLQAIDGKKLGAKVGANWNVQVLPAEYVGTFNGSYLSTTNASITNHSALTLTVAKTGKLTGSVNLGGKKYSLKADAFDAIDFDTGMMSVTSTAFICTSPKLTNVITLAVSTNEFGLGVADVASLAAGSNVYDGQAVRNGWSDKTKPAVRTAALFKTAGYYTLTLTPEDNEADIYGAGYLTLTVSAKGAVKASGKLADGTAVSGSSVLQVWSADDVSTVIAISPSAYKGGEFYLNVKFDQNDEATTLTAAETVSWINLVTTKNSNGPFVRMPDVQGGWYSQLKSLYDVYAVASPYSLGLDADAITNEVSVTFNAKGTGVDALPKSNNAYSVKLTLTPKTGLFNGSFNEAGVKTAYKLYGVLTPYLVAGEKTAGLGFYSIPVATPKTQRSEVFRLFDKTVDPTPNPVPGEPEI